MSIKVIMNEYKEHICPSCEHYANKEYNDCNIMLDINHNAKCVNYKCLNFCKNIKENKVTFIKEKESKLYVTAKKHNSIMKLV